VSNVPARFSLLGIIGGLMVAENLGDVHDEINFLHDLAGIRRPEGNFIDGWTAEDFKRVRHSGRELA
jgi:hypothetical protein